MSEIVEAKQSVIEPVPMEVFTQSRAAVLSALFIAGFGTFVNLYVTQPLLPRFREIFRASELLVSLTVSAPVLGAALAAPLVGLLADGVGRKRVIVAAMLILSLPTALAATAANLGPFIVWRFLQGLFIPGIITVAMAYISEESPRRLVGSTMATYVTGTVVGGFAGRFIAGLCANGYGWRFTFVVLGVLTLACSFVTWRLLPRSRKFIRQSGAAASVQSLWMHLRNPQLLATYAIGFNVLFCLAGAFTYVNFYLADEPFGLGPAALGAVFTVYLIGAVVTPVGGVVLDRMGYRRTLTGAVGMVLVGVLLTLIASVPVIITGLTLIATGVFICQSAASSYVGKAAGKARSSAAGLYVAFYYLGGCIGSILPGFFWKQAGWVGCVAIICCMQALTALIARLLWKD
jgi:predicted MFS family arabinose efflux permease